MPPFPDRKQRRPRALAQPSQEEVPGVLEPPLSAELKKIFASSHKLVECKGTSVPGAAASSSSEPMVAQPCVYVLRPTVHDATSSASAEVLPPPAKERGTEPDTGRFVLEYVAKAQSLLEAPVTPESDSEA